jgi:predicted transglutaminase-like cysteine proteinase
MNKRLFGLAALLLGLGAGMSGGAAMDLHGSGHLPLVAKGTTKTPIGARQFCLAWPAECQRIDTASERVALTEALKRDLVEINGRFNTQVVAITDEAYYQKREFWTYPEGFGDCEDFALAKRRALMERGWPASVLRMALVRQSNGEAHAVLVAVTDAGDFVLDNLVGDVLDWEETNYKFVKMQTAQTMSEWVDVEDDRVLWVASK